MNFDLTYTFWLSVAGILVLIELSTLSFYLLMIATGALFGALFAFLGFSEITQFVVTAVASISLVIALKKYKKYNKTNSIISNKNNIQLDIGEVVIVDKENSWNDNFETTVFYRGTPWTAINEDKTANTGIFYIKEVDGVNLRISKNK